MNTILIVDDELTILKVVEAYLQTEGYTTHTAQNGEQALAAFHRYQPDLLILDIMLPGMDGLTLLQQIRRESDVYVLLLTAKSEEIDRVVGLTVGADDYLTKPFSPRELVARVKAILRRGRTPATDEKSVYQFPHLRVDLQKFKVWREAEEIELTALEFKLLQTFIKNAHIVLTREQLLRDVWGYDYYGDERVVDVHIRHLRQKLEPDPTAPQFIQTVRGIGYRFEDEAT